MAEYREFRPEGAGETAEQKRKRELDARRKEFDRRSVLARVDELKRNPPADYKDDLERLAKQNLPADYVKDAKEKFPPPDEDKIFGAIRMRSIAFGGLVKEPFIVDAAKQLGLSVPETRTRYAAWLKRRGSR